MFQNVLVNDNGPDRNMQHIIVAIAGQNCLPFL
jgi:hypothetical protein